MYARARTAPALDSERDGQVLLDLDAHAVPQHQHAGQQVGDLRRRLVAPGVEHSAQLGGPRRRGMSLRASRGAWSLRSRRSPRTARRCCTRGPTPSRGACPSRPPCPRRAPARARRRRSRRARFSRWSSPSADRGGPWRPARRPAISRVRRRCSRRPCRTRPSRLSARGPRGVSTSTVRIPFSLVKPTSLSSIVMRLPGSALTTSRVSRCGRRRFRGRTPRLPGRLSGLARGRGRRRRREGGERLGVRPVEEAGRGPALGALPRGY